MHIIWLNNYNMKQYFGNYKGIVVKSYPNKNGICKVFVPDVYPEEYKEKPEMLPDTIPVIPVGFNNDGEKNGIFATPKENSIVFVFFDGGNINYPYYFGIIPAGKSYNYLAKISKENTNITNNSNKINFDGTVLDTTDYEDNAEEKVNNNFDKIYEELSNKINLDELTEKFIEEELSYLQESAGIFEEIGETTSSFAETVSTKVKKTGKYIISKLKEITEEDISGLVESLSELTKFIDQIRIEPENIKNKLLSSLEDFLGNNKDILSKIFTGGMEGLISRISFLPTSATSAKTEETEEEEELSEEEIIARQKAILNTIILKEKAKNKELSTSEIISNIIEKYDMDISDSDLNELKNNINNSIDDKLIHIVANKASDITFDAISEGINSVAPILQTLTFFIPEISKSIMAPLQNLLELGKMFDISIRDKEDGKKAIDIKIKGDINILHQGNVFKFTDGNKIELTTGNNTRLSSDNYDIPPAVSLGLIFEALLSEEGKPITGDSKENNKWAENVIVNNIGEVYNSNTNYISDNLNAIEIKI